MPRAATTPTPNDAAPASYEDAVQELEQIVAAMEGSALPLDRLLDSYTRAAALLEFCRGRLEAVETQVKVLEKGQLAPWVNDSPSSLRSLPPEGAASGFGRPGAAGEPASSP